MKNKPVGLIEKERLRDFDIDDFYTGSFIKVRAIEPNYTVDVEYTDNVADILKEAHGTEIGEDAQFLVVLEILDDLICSGAYRLIIIDKLNSIRETLGLISMDCTLIMRSVDRIIDNRIADIRIDML